jgi:hypothetical protein
MEYRDVQYMLEEDDRGGWQWAVVLGSPPTLKSGHAVSKGTAILKVWTTIDRTLDTHKLRLVQSNRPKT